MREGADTVVSGLSLPVAGSAACSSPSSQPTKPPLGLCAPRQVFNAGQVRRKKRSLSVEPPERHLLSGRADYFDQQNQGAAAQREVIARETLHALLLWLDQGGDVGIFDVSLPMNERGRGEVVAR